MISTVLFSKSEKRINYLRDKYIASNSLNEDEARQEYIFNILILGLIGLTSTALILSTLRHLLNAQSSENVPTLFLVIPVLITITLYRRSRKKYSNTNIYCFLSLLLIVGTYALYKYGYVMPQGLLIYVLVIIMSGILISAIASLLMTLIIALILSGVALLQYYKVLDPYTGYLNDPLLISNLILFLTIFTVILIVTYLSNREIERSLSRARQSENLLRKERNSLEIKVKQRTQELERAQVEKTMELYRFAEFGRLSSSLLHDLANPLTAISLNFSALEATQRSEIANQVRDGINNMEQYVQSARRQLRYQNNDKYFDVKPEIERVCTLLKPKAKLNNVVITHGLLTGLIVYGDMTKLNQIMSNVISNAIDAYVDSPGIKNYVKVRAIVDQTREHIIITTTDKGIGIPNDKLIRVFDPFYTTKEQDKGTGIGLTIVKRIVEEDFKGSIQVKSSNKTGTTFTVLIPINKQI